MRIVGGQWRGRRIEAPKGMGTRPTADRVRETMFNILDARGLVRDAHVLDAFCGSGALGIEALSRGAAQAIFIDFSRKVLKVVERNLAALLVPRDRALLMPGDLRYPVPAPSASNLIFMDPPYNQDLVVPALRALDIAGWFEPQAHIMAESSDEFDLPSGYRLVDRRRAGISVLSLIRKG